MISLVGTYNFLSKTRDGLCYLTKLLFHADLFLSHGCDVESSDKKGNTALHYACSRGSDGLSGQILKATNSTYIANHQNHQGKSPLHLAAPRGLVETTELLLRRGASVEATDKRCFTPILACAKNENVAYCMANMLVEYFKNNGTEEGSNRASRSFDSFRRSVDAYNRRTTGGSTTSLGADSVFVAPPSPTSTAKRKKKKSVAAATTVATAISETAAATQDAIESNDD
jgi:ankyrin repeat protein